MARKTWSMDPEIAAVVDYDNVMICCTRRYFTNAKGDVIRKIYSQDAGIMWTPMYSLEGNTVHDEHAASLSSRINRSARD
ncbi:MAG: hypothetical protein ABIK28_01940 [Planctomycetota bacterium]